MQNKTVPQHTSFSKEKAGTICNQDMSVLDDKYNE